MRMTKQQFKKSLLIFFFVWISLLAGYCYYIESENKRLESKRDSIITEHHRLQREIDWQYDSITTIFNRQLDTLIYKANKYDSLMNFKDGRN